MKLPRKKKLSIHRSWNSNQACLLEDLPQRQRKDLKRSWVSPNRQQRKGFLLAPQPWMNCFANSDQQERLKWGRHAVQVAWAPNQRVFNGSSAMGEQTVDIGLQKTK